MTQPTGKYPEAIYRVSLRAIIRNEQGEVLCVKEKGSDWTLPGGGLDHGEEWLQGLRRELEEEVAITAPFVATIRGVDPYYVASHDHYQLHVLYEVVFQGTYSYGVGVDADEVAFMDPRVFKDSPLRAHQLMYKWCVDQTHSVVRW